MSQHSRVPKFGNWEGDENVPYTTYFDKAREGKSGGKLINPNDPQENPEFFSSPQAPSKIKAEEPEHDHIRLTHKRDEGYLKQATESPVRHDNMARRMNSGEVCQNLQKQKGGSEHGSVDRSPYHPHSQGSRTPVHESSSHGTPGRSRLRPDARSDGNVEKGASVPKFGEWDESNPSSADGYTHIFNIVRAEKQAGGTITSGMASSYYADNQKLNANGNAKCCCFSWRK